jgi:hypothetical protein
MSWFTTGDGTFSSEDIDEDIDSKSGLLSEKTSTKSRASISRLHFIFAVLHMTFGLLWVSFLWSIVPVCRPTPELLRPLELRMFSLNLTICKFTDTGIAAVAEAIEYKTVVFDVSGGGTREDPITPYEGPPTPEKDMRWYELINGKIL